MIEKCFGAGWGGHQFEVDLSDAGEGAEGAGEEFGEVEAGVEDRRNVRFDHDQRTAPPPLRQPLRLLAGRFCVVLSSFLGAGSDSSGWGWRCRPG